MVDAAAAAGLATILTSLGACIALVIKSITTSRCSEIRLPCGCSCVREVPAVVEPGDVT
jgi:hypothetical protein